MAGSRLKPGNVERFIHSPDGPLWRWLFRFGNRVRNGAVLRANVRTGNMRARMYLTMRDSAAGPVARIGNDAAYARYVHEGRGEIIAPPGHVLRWVAPDGRVVFSRRSGAYAGNPFLRDALQAEIRDL